MRGIETYFMNCSGSYFEALKFINALFGVFVVDYQLLGYEDSELRGSCPKMTPTSIPPGSVRVTRCPPPGACCRVSIAPAPGILDALGIWKSNTDIGPRSTNSFGIVPLYIILTFYNIDDSQKFVLGTLFSNINILIGSITSEPKPVLSPLHQSHSEILITYGLGTSGKAPRRDRKPTSQKHSGRLERGELIAHMTQFYQAHLVFRIDPISFLPLTRIFTLHTNRGSRVDRATATWRWLSAECRLGITGSAKTSTDLRRHGYKPFFLWIYYQNRMWMIDGRYVSKAHF